MKVYNETYRLTNNKLVALVICAYMLIYPPFLSSAYVNIYLRLTLEIGLLCYLIIKSNIKYSIIFILILYIVYSFFSLGSDDLRNYISSLNKILFFILLISMLKKRQHLAKYLKNHWIIIWKILSISAIIAFLGYEFKIIKFSEFEFAEGSYNYYINPILGALLPKNFFGVEMARVTGYMIEPNLLSFFFGFNLLIEKHIFENKSHKSFIYLNAIAGLFTLSTTYMFFIIAYLVYIRLDKLLANKLLIIILLVILLLVLINVITMDLLEFSSASDRLLRMNSGLSLLRNNNIVTLLFGNGASFSSREVGMGISAGLLSVLVEKGLILLAVVILLMWKYSKFDLVLWLYLLYYNLVVELFWYPIFWVGISIAYATYYHNKYKTPVIVNAEVLGAYKEELNCENSNS